MAVGGMAGSWRWSAGASEAHVPGKSPDRPDRKGQCPAAGDRPPTEWAGTGGSRGLQQRRQWGQDRSLPALPTWQLWGMAYPPDPAPRISESWGRVRHGACSPPERSSGATSPEFSSVQAQDRAWHMQLSQVQGADGAVAGRWVDGQGEAWPAPHTARGTFQLLPHFCLPSSLWGQEAPLAKPSPSRQVHSRPGPHLPQRSLLCLSCFCPESMGA